MSKLRHRPDYVVDLRLIDRSSDRRSLPRFEPTGGRCWIGWWRDGRPRILPGVMLDVGQGGVAVLSRKPPPPGQSAWICPADSPGAGWIEGAVLRVNGPGVVGAALGRPSLIGLGFRDWCSWDSLRSVMFQAAAQGGSVAGPPPLPKPGDCRS